MLNSSPICPVCTLYLREGISLQDHLETHPKEQVIEALLKFSYGGATQPVVQEVFSNVSAFVPVQTFGNSNSSFLSQGTPYVNSQPQTATALTYQHFTTSNGSTVIPQYIQVPAIVNGCNTFPIISNPSANFVPNESINYAQTVYSPLYSAYIPQSYPLTQPVFTSFPVNSVSPVETNTQTFCQDSSSDLEVNYIDNEINNDDSDDQVETEDESSVFVGKCNVSTNTEPEKEFPEVDGSKKSSVISLNTINKSKNDMFEEDSSLKYNEVQTQTKVSIRTLQPKITSVTSLAIANPQLISTPVLRFEKDSRPIESTLPLQSDTPYFSSPVLNFIKSEDVTDCPRPQHSTALNDNFLNNSNNTVEYFTENVNSEVNTFCNKTVCNNDLKNCSENEETDENEVSFVERFEKNQRENEDVNENSSDLINTKDEGSVNHELQIMHDEECGMEDYEQQEEFQIDIEENKADILGVCMNENISEQTYSKNVEENLNGSNICTYQERITPKDSEREDPNENNSDPEIVKIQAVDSNNRINVNAQGILTFNNYNLNEKCFNTYYEKTDESENKKKKNNTPNHTEITYTQGRDFQDLEMPSIQDCDNYMEVDSVEILINNDVQCNPSIEPITFKPTNVVNLCSFLKTENQVNNKIDALDRTKEAKSEFSFNNNNSSSLATSSQVNEANNDFPELSPSPLPLNIQADESMPARGELSEQESLGAENSTWNLFHGRSLDDWKTDQTQLVSVIGTKKNRKAFKCSVCNEVFSCPKERKIHKNTVHLIKSSKAEKSLSVSKKQKNYECSYCFEVFTCLRDRKAHVTQKHYFESKTKKSLSKIKQENGELETVNLDIKIKNETEQNSNVKTENSISVPETYPNQVRCCSLCNLPFTSVKKLRDHLKEAHSEVRFKCETCSATFEKEAEYNQHLLIHPLACETCGKTFHKKLNLGLHMKRHLAVKPYECSLCPKSFITRQKLDEHTNSHSGIKPIKCNLCDKKFSRHSNLIQHRNLHHFNVKKKVKDFICRCGEVFHSAKKLEWHKEVHDTKPKSCPYCSQKFIHTASVTRHIRRTHLPDYLPSQREYDNVQCPICEKVYLRASLTVHMRVHNGEKPFACQICGKRFSTKWNLELHGWTHQSRNNMPFKCNICKSAFFREQDFTAHLNSHKNHKPYTCNICGQKFVRKYSCLRHQQEHEKTKQFSCSILGCSKSFHRKYYLLDHMKVHTGVRPHTCHICGKASSTKSNHNKHLRIHDTREPINSEN